jgi:hypothetical protein
MRCTAVPEETMKTNEAELSTRDAQSMAKPLEEVKEARDTEVSLAGRGLEIELKDSYAYVRDREWGNPTKPLLILTRKEWKSLRSLIYRFYKVTHDDSIELFNLKEQKRALEEELEMSRPKPREEENKRLRPGSIYLISSPQGLYKIGRAIELKARMRAFESQFPFSVTLIHSFPVEDCPTAERNLHEKYSHRRANGEWFSLSSKEVEEIKLITEM